MNFHEREIVMHTTPKYPPLAEGAVNGTVKDEQAPRTIEVIPVESDRAYLKVFQADETEATHPNVNTENGQKSIRATTTQGYLCQSPPISDYPNKPLEANFRVFIDNNTYDDAVILILDVIDLEQDKIIQKIAVTRKAFPKAKAFNLLKLPFTPPRGSRISLRAYYFGYAYVVLDKIALLDPSETTWDAGGVETEQPGSPAKPERDAIIGSFKVANLPSQHPDVFYHRGGKAIKATTQQGFLSYGPYVTGCPAKSLDVYFCVYIDNNTADNRAILHLDVHDVFQKKVLADRAITRQQFPVAGQFTLFKLSFTPTERSKLEFRIFYKGYAYVAANYIIVTDPAKIQLESPADIPDDIFSPVRPNPRPEPNKPQPQPEPKPQPQPVGPGTILHLPQMTPEIVKQQQGRNHGGTFNNGTYTPSDRGGLEFVREVDFDRQFQIEFEIEGNIANSHLGEMNGGKVSLFTILQQNGPYYLGLQRMRYEYRGGGTLRVMVTHNYGSEHGAGFIITVPELSGHYTTLNWGNEPHRFKLLVKGNRCRLFIDGNYSSPWAWSTGGVRGKRRVSFMLGNRVPPMSKQHPITRYKWVKITTS